MSYLALSESLDVVSVSPSVQLNMGTTPVACAITRDALIDLGDHHGLRGTEAEVLRALGPQIERIARAKFRAGRFGKDCELVIRSTDLLRYGFSGARSVSNDVVQSAATQETSTSV
jgi:hypothetical protein